MLDKFKKVSNPLTIIAIFAGITEISGTAVLPFISDANQATYLIFLIGFPVLLVTAFFLTLNFNNRVLYAPSDFSDESNFVRLIDLKIEKETRELDLKIEGTKRRARSEYSLSLDSLQKQIANLERLISDIARAPEHATSRVKTAVAEQEKVRLSFQEAQEEFHAFEQYLVDIVTSGEPTVSPKQVWALLISSGFTVNSVFENEDMDTTAKIWSVDKKVLAHECAIMHYPEDRAIAKKIEELLLSLPAINSVTLTEKGIGSKRKLGVHLMASP